MTTRPIEYNEIEPSIKKEATKAGILLSEKADYIGMFDNGILIGFSGVLKRKGTAVLKCAYVKPDHRKKGIHTYFLKERIRNLKGYKITANCTHDSVRNLLRMGFRIVKRYKNGITKVAYENL